MAFLPNQKPHTWLNPASMLVGMMAMTGVCAYRVEKPSGG